MASPDLAHNAESLIRSLDGVVSAHVRKGPRGIDAIHVTARDDDAARFMAAHVRSALLAGLATPVTAARIHVRVGHTPSSDVTVEPPIQDHEEDQGPRDQEPGDSDLPRTRHRIWLVEPRGSRTQPVTRIPLEAAAPGTGAPTPDTKTTIGGSATAVAEPADSADARSPVRRPRLVAVDVDRPGDGRVVCRVSIAFGTLVHRAEAVAVDLPGAAAQASAQAAVRALVDAGISSLELTGLREVEIAGREYVLVALRKSDTSRRHRSGSAPIVGSPERSAAEAAVAAANELI